MKNIEEKLCDLLPYFLACVFIVSISIGTTVKNEYNYSKSYDGYFYVVKFNDKAFLVQQSDCENK